ncbi:MAG: choice-of-anchor L domain-containing protein [Candidatus Competibacteraceae bacterium]|jgi:hypothetical protein|nr:choice-of-anchor L domain-containing protein [Candidatus Competibacteraceae bacterium]
MNFPTPFNIPGQLALVLGLSLLIPSLGSAQEREGQTKVHTPTRGPSNLIVKPLSAALVPADLVRLLVGPGVTFTNVVYTGDLLAAGTFTGGKDIVGFERGIILGTGKVEDVVGPNTLDRTNTNLEEPGDADLAALAGFNTKDAAVLQFDFIPTEPTLSIQYVFSSEEYNEFVGDPFNDVFAFFVNGSNCATIGGSPVSINTVNNGNPFGSGGPNSDSFINNVISDGGSINTEMDGLTVVLTCSASVNPGVANTLKLAIADGSDALVDAAVFIDTGILGDRVGVMRDGQWFLDLNGNDELDEEEVNNPFTFGQPGDEPIVGDWNNDGFTEIGVRRGNKWFLDVNDNRILDSCGIDICIENYGIPSDQAVAGDWNGDGFSAVGVKRGSAWFLDENGNDAWDGCVQDTCIPVWGLPHDVPVAGSWRPQ